MPNYQLQPFNLSDIRSFENLFEQMMGNATRAAHPAHNVIPIDVVENESNLSIRASLPGVNPEHLEIQVEENVLTIKGETKSEELSEGSRVFRRELSYGAFSRAVRLPKNLDNANATAQFDNGFVNITIPKLPEEKPKSLRIPISTGLVADSTPSN